MLGRRLVPGSVLASIVVSILGSACARTPPPEARSAPYVEGGQLHDPDGRVVTLRGANLANAHKGPPYFGLHGPDDFARLRRDLGMNSIRLLMTWAAIEPQRGAYNTAYLDALRLRLDWAQAAGLRVILDMHQDLYGEGFGGDGAPRWTCDEARYAAF